MTLRRITWFEKVDAAQKYLVRKSWCCAEVPGSKKLMLRRRTWFKKVDAMRKYLVRKSTSSENIFILIGFSTKKVFIPKSTYARESPILKSLLGRSFEKVAILKR